MTVLFDILLVSTVVFLSVFIAFRFAGVVRQQEIAIGTEKTGELLQFLEEKEKRVQNLGTYMHEGEIAGILTEIAENGDAFYEYENISYISVFFAGVSSADKDFSDIIIAARNGRSYSYTERGKAEVNAGFHMMEYDKVQTLLNSEENSMIFYDDPTVYCLRERTPVISFMGKIYDTGFIPERQVAGVYIMNIPVERVDALLSGGDRIDPAQIRVLNRQGLVIYAMPEGGEGAPARPTSETDEVYRIERRSRSGEMDVIYELPEKMLYYAVQRIQIPIFFICVAAVLLSILISAAIGTYYTKRIELLTSSMAGVEKGDLSIRVEEKGDDEIASLAHTFNDMCGKLQSYIDTVYEAELQRKNAEINALQMQINPHFLYNTLESIKAEAVKEGAAATPEMIVLLGNMFRMISHTDERFVTLDDELAYINTYLKLQSYRYDEVLDVDLKVEESELECGIPKLTLQPVVENIIRHGFEGIDRRGLVGITVKRNGEKLEITVYDNGLGMEEETLNTLRKKLEEKPFARDAGERGRRTGGGIGILNVHERLRLLFGKDYGITISSIISMGTAVKIVIPALTPEEMEHVQVIDR